MGRFFDKVLNTGGHSGTNHMTVTEVTGLDFSMFAEVSVRAMYQKIIYECSDRAMIPKEIQKEGYLITVHDSHSPHKWGLVTHIVEALICTARVYIRKVKHDGDVYTFETLKENEVKEFGENIPPDIIELDFRCFHEVEVIRCLFNLLASVLATLSKNVTVSGALLIKIHALSEMIENSQNMKPLVEQLKQLNNGLTQGNPGFVDAKSSIDFPSYDVTPTESAAKFIYNMISSLTGLPNSYLFGEVVGGLGDMSKGEERRFNQAIKRYYHSIYSGVIHAVYDRVFDYKQINTDIVGLVQLFTFIETTTLLTDEGKLKFMVNNTSMDEEDFALNGESNNQPL